MKGAEAEGVWRRIIAATGWKTKQEMAVWLKLSPATVYRRGSGEIPLTWIRKIADSFHVTIDWLLNGDEVTAPDPSSLLLKKLREKGWKVVLHTDERENGRISTRWVLAKQAVEKLFAKTADFECLKSANTL